MATAFRIVPYDDARHGAFVHGTFLRCLSQQFPWCHVPPAALLERLSMATGTCRVAEVPGVEDAFAGWLATNGNSVRFCYVRHAYRKLGCMTALLDAAGAIFPMTRVLRPMTVLFWTRACSRLVERKGWNLTPEVE